MKPAWNALLITLGSVMPLSLVLLPTFPSMAQVQGVESPAPNTAEKPTTLNLIGQDGTVELVKYRKTLVIPGITPVSGGAVLAESQNTTSQAPTLVIPEITPVSGQDVPQTNTGVAASSPEATDTKETTTTTSPSSTDKPETTPAKDKDTEAAPSPEEIAKQQKLIEADRLYMGGQFAAAEQLYRQVKTPFSQAASTMSERRDPITDPAKLAPAGQAYWRMANAGLAQNLESKIFVPLQLLVEKYPEFIPGQLQYAQALKDYKRGEEAIQVLERATTLYPNQPDLLKAKIAALRESKQWLEASLAARQFALLNPDRPEAEEFAKIADENLERYQSYLRAELRGNTIANVLTGAVGYALTGSLFGPFTAIQSTAMLLRGESAVGERIADRAKRQLELVEDPETVEYVRELGNKLATVAGRNDFEYEFYVINDEDLNAFALPGGKVFVNAGAILKTDSEAELAGLMAHELSHAVLSHGFQLATQGNLTANVTQYIPYGGTLANLVVLDYSRDMERQADILGTRLLVSTGYAADGMRNLMLNLEEQERDRPVFSWLSSHPVTNDRVEYLENLIERNGYNRYTYEGVARHAQIKARLKKLLEEQKEKEEKEREEEKAGRKD